jgi:hypothetical protein
VLTKGRAIEEFKEGKTVNEVRTKYRCWGGKPLAQWKAHVTMGTYEEHEIHEEDKDLETITKEDVIDLISSGIPIEEIHQSYPTSFTLRQLRSLKRVI